MKDLNRITGTSNKYDNYKTPLMFNTLLDMNELKS